MIVRTIAEIAIPAAPEEVFATATDPAIFHQFFTGYGPIPRMVKVENINTSETREGTIRHIHNADGSVLEEHILEFTAPTTQRYAIRKGLKPPFSLLVSTAEGRWNFEPTRDGVHIAWHFQFTLTSPLVWPLAKPVAVFFQKAQQRCLQNLRNHVVAPQETAA